MDSVNGHRTRIVQRVGHTFLMAATRDQKNLARSNLIACKLEELSNEASAFYRSRFERLLLGKMTFFA